MSKTPAKKNNIERAHKGRIIYGMEKSKSAKAVNGKNFFVKIEHPSGHIDKDEKLNFYATISSAARGARRKRVKLHYPIFKASEVQ